MYVAVYRAPEYVTICLRQQHAIDIGRRAQIWVPDPLSYSLTAWNISLSSSFVVAYDHFLVSHDLEHSFFYFDTKGLK
jgi:hypothetical protein